MARVTFDYRTIPHARGGIVAVSAVLVSTGSFRDIVALADTGATQIHPPYYYLDGLSGEEASVGEDTCTSGAGGAFMAKKAVLRRMEIEGLQRWNDVDVIIGAKNGIPFPVLGMAKILDPYSLTFHVGAKKLTISGEISP